MYNMSFMHLNILDMFWLSQQDSTYKMYGFS